MTRVPINEIVAAADLGLLFNVRSNVISNWRKRYEDFPDPFIVVANGSTPLYIRSEVIAWYRTRLSPALIDALKETP